MPPLCHRHARAGGDPEKKLDSRFRGSNAQKCKHNLFKTLLLLILLLFPPTLARAEAILNIQEVTSPHGIKAWLVEDHSLPIISMDYAFRGAGSALDPADKQGLARMASNTMDEGAGDLNAQDFQKELRDRVISLHFEAGRDHFMGALKTLSKNKTRAFELTALALTRPRFDVEAIGRMRDSNLSRIRSSLSEPEWMAARLQNDKAYSGHPYAMNSGGTLSSLPTITRADLKDFHTRLMGKNNLVVAVAGDITPAELGQKLDETFGALPDVKTPAIPDLTLQNQGKTFLFKQDIPQTVVEILQPGIKRDDPAYHAAQIMNFVLGSSGFGSRLTEEIREKRGLTYGIYSNLSQMDHVQTLGVSSSAANDNIAQILDLTRAEFTKMKTTPITDSELADAKSYLIGSLPLSLTSTDAISGLMLSLALDHLPKDYLDKRARAISSTTKEDVQKIAQRLLSPEKFVTILVGNPKDVPKGAHIVKSLPNVQ